MMIKFLIKQMVSYVAFIGGSKKMLPLPCTYLVSVSRRERGFTRVSPHNQERGWARVERNQGVLSHG